MKRRVKQWIGFLIMLAGLAFLAGPFVAGGIAGNEQKKVADQVEKENQEKKSDKKDAFYQAALAYNQSLVKNGQDGMKTKADVEHFALDARDYGYSQNTTGTIEIPRMNVKLGLYLGASEENMSKGAAVFGMTSMPLGNKNENVAVAGHRGWWGTPMFRDIQLLQKNDPIYVTTPWKTLVYRVYDIQIVTPEDNSWCKIQKGRSLLTLMTCHPYGYNYQRYIVFAKLTNEKKPSDQQIKKNNKDSFDASDRIVTQKDAKGNTQSVTVSPASIQPDGREYGAFWSNLQILAEDKMKIVAGIAAVLVLFTGIYLTVATIRDIRQRKQHKITPEGGNDTDEPS